MTSDSIPGGLDDFLNDSGELVDVEDAFDLGEDAACESEVAAP